MPQSFSLAPDSLHRLKKRISIPRTAERHELHRLEVEEDVALLALVENGKQLLADVADVQFIADPGGGEEDRPHRAVRNGFELGHRGVSCLLTRVRLGQWTSMVPNAPTPTQTKGDSRACQLLGCAASRYQGPFRQVSCARFQKVSGYPVPPGIAGGLGCEVLVALSIVYTAWALVGQTVSSNALH